VSTESEEFPLLLFPVIEIEGLAVAPQVFTRVFQTVIVHLHALSVPAHSYLDDSLLKEFDSEILSRHICLFIRFLLDLGFLISNLGEAVRQEE
jgi:hypothetical protein